ncbi:MAG: hypothetical protein MMC33_003447 [Icmadophila ericetorum]|nr:hypothetical protein [Icmadophila ericetorum]
MPRRIVRTGLQLGTLTITVLVLIFLLDNRYSVLPNKIHGYLPTHHPGLVLTDITVTTCSSLGLFSSCSLDEEVWHRVDKDLYLDSGWFSHAFVHVQRKREEELLETDRVIMDIRVGRLDPVTSEKGEGSERWESRPGNIWLLRSTKRHASDSQKALTAIDVLFGADAVEPRLGWEIKDQALLSNVVPEPRLSVRRGPPHPVTKPTLRVRKDGKFKILQVSDMHLSTGLGTCRDVKMTATSNPHCDADPRTIEFVSKILDSEKPDFVVLSGDQVNGETAPDTQSALFKFASIFIDRNIPYACIFGNHDDEGSLSRQGMMSLLDSLPLSLSEPGPATIDGVGNYAIEVLAKSSSHSALTLYLLDTHGYSPDENHFKGYDWIKKSQIDWFTSTAASKKTQPSHKDYSHIRLNMAFIHIPLPEYRNIDLRIAGSGAALEAPTAPGFNSGFKDALISSGIFAVSCGHDHANDYCTLEHHSEPSKKNGQESIDGKLWMCYAGGSGFGGYGGYGGYKRRVRVWEFDFERISVGTWKRVEGEKSEEGGRVDEKTVVDSGRVLDG